MNIYDETIQENQERDVAVEDLHEVNEGDHESADVGDHQLIECQKDVERWKEQYMRVAADVENMRRRMAQEREQWLYTAQAGIFKDLLAVVDNFERALAEQTKEHSSESLVQGVDLIHKELVSLLNARGVQEITDNTTFNPELHEAVMQVEADGKESDAIVDVFQKGYMFKDRVLRPAKVSVAR